jgi:hypothetical protein
MNRHVIDTAVSILAKHIQTPPPTPSNQINVLTTAIAIIQASINKPTITSGPITEQPTFYEGQLRRGPIETAGKLAIADTSDPMNPPTETNIYSVNITPKYSDKPNDDPVRPYSYTITPNIGGVVDKTAEINRLNDELQKQKEKIDDLTKQVKSTTATLSAPVVAEQ